MPTWIIEPRDPLIVRDGRPFGPTPGARATSLPFPFPSTISGGIRTRAGVDQAGRFDESAGTLQFVQGIAMRGPLLVELDAGERVTDWFAPAPADALLIEPEDRAKYHPAPSAGQVWRACLQPFTPTHPPAWNLGGDVAYPVGPEHYDPSKPLADPPRFWYWTQFAEWLCTPQSGPVRPADLGHGGPQQEQRMHVSIAGDRLAAREGALFQTRGLEFTGQERQRLALAAASSAAFPHFQGGPAPLGGERRLVHWRRWADGDGDDLLNTRCPDKIRQRIVEKQACRLVLLTPALFTGGWLPGWNRQAHTSGMTPAITAVALARPQVVSGWNMQKDNGPDRPRGGPRPTRRLAPAGAVYFLKLAGSAEAIGKWIDSVWLQPVSDSAQDGADGFGLAALGTWDGQPGRMEVLDDTMPAPR